MLTFQCELGYMPQEQVTSTCLHNSSLVPIPHCEGTIQWIICFMHVIDLVNINMCAVIDCGAPSTNTGVDIEPFNDTRLNAVITFHCQDRDSSLMAVCRSNGEWVPSPTSFKCKNGILGELASC